MKDAGVSDVSLRLGAESVALSGGDARPESRGAGRVTDYLALLKPRVMSLVVFSGFAGLYAAPGRSEEHTSELQSLMRISYAVFCLNKKTHKRTANNALHLDTNIRQQ